MKPQIRQKVVKAEPQRRGGREVRAAAADGAAGKHAEGRDQTDAAGGKVRHHIRRAYPGLRRQREKTAEKDQRHPIGDGHGQKIARGGECHQRREQHQTNRVGNYDHVVVMRERTRSARAPESGEPELWTSVPACARIGADAVNRIAGKFYLAMPCRSVSAGGWPRPEHQNYLSAPCTKAELSFEPSPCMTAMMATEMPAATRPYSTAVAPD